VRGRCLLPIHNGTFDLSSHNWEEPFQRIVALARAQGVPVSTPQMGERVNLRAPQQGAAWWEGVPGEARPVSIA